MGLETSVKKAGRISFWIGGCSGLAAIGLCLILYCSKAGPHDEGFGYVFLSLLLAILISFGSFVTGVILSFALGTNLAINSKRAKKQKSEGARDV